MIPFNVVTLGDFLKPDSLSQALESFSIFIESVTSKHRKKSKLYVIDGGKSLNLIMEQARQLDITDNLHIVRSNDPLRVREVYNEASALLLPIKKTIGKIIPEALAFGIPVICFDTPDMREYIDNTCGLMVRSTNRSSCVEDIGHLIHTLYFDPEARKLLKQGALNKYERDFSWNNFEVNARKSLSL